MQLNGPDNHPVTRMEILDAIDTAFSSPPTSKSQIITAAEDARAREELVAVLATLPNRSFHTVRDLWEHLPDIPVEA